MDMEKRGLVGRWFEDRQDRILQNKTGFEMTIGMVVIVVLSVSLLIAAMVILNKQTGFFSSTLELFSQKNNLDSVIAACNTLAQQEAQNEFCCVPRELVSEKNKTMTTCNELGKRSSVSGRVNMLECGECGYEE